MIPASARFVSVRVGRSGLAGLSGRGCWTTAPVDQARLLSPAPCAGFILEAFPACGDDHSMTDSSRERVSERANERAGIPGRCLCGGCSYQVTGSPKGLVHCHCQRCRKHHGSSFASFFTFEGVEMAWLSGRELLNTYASSERVSRAFCGVCGSVMPDPEFSDALDASRCPLPSGNFLEMPEPGLIHHVDVSSRAPWYDVPVNARQSDRAPPEWHDPDLEDLDRRRDNGSIAGSCLCGDVRFEASGPLFMMNCHCTRCRLSRSSAILGACNQPVRVRAHFQLAKRRRSDHDLQGSRCRSIRFGFLQALRLAGAAGAESEYGSNQYSRWLS